MVGFMDAVRNLTHYNWADYCHWDDGQRWELIDGEAFNMSPAPMIRHQRIVRELFIEMRSYFAKKSCELLISPVDVKLSNQDIVQPDLLVVCDPRQIKETHIEGPPALVVEILSPSTQRHDRLRKTFVYAKFGIKEYWLVTPYPALVEILLLDGASYRIHQGYGQDERLTSPSFPGLEIDLTKVFNFPVPPDELIDEVREGTPEYVVRSE